MIKLTKTSIVKNILAGYPSLSASDVARKAKCDVSVVYQIKSKMKANRAIDNALKTKDAIARGAKEHIIRGEDGVAIRVRTEDGIPIRTLRMQAPKKGEPRLSGVISPSGLLRMELEKAPIDMVNNPPHYTVGGIETIDFIQAKLTVAEYKGFLKGTILAYASRIGHKDGTDDAGKIGWYAKKLQEL
jgi:hypothetical protein